MPKSEIKILMIDDDEEDFIIVRDIIREIDHHKYSFDWVKTYEEGLKRISEKKHDVYLVDYHIGAHTGLELIKEAIKRGCDVPLIILTGQNDFQIDNLALEAGASDFLVKGIISSQSLESAIRYSIANMKHIKEMILLNASLENRVQERTMILEEAIAELNQTKQVLNDALIKEKELNDLKSRFVSMASHEFRTPLATILSSLSLVTKYAEQGDKEKQAKHLERIKTSVHNLTDIITDVLSLSKLEEGKLPISPTQFNLAEFVNEITRDLQSVAKKEQKINFTHSGKSEIKFDKKILRHILFNLISNAIKFSPDGKPIEVGTKISDNELNILVNDKGIGVSEEDQKHLFERFFRAQNATNIQGTGLGLNIVAKYVEMLEGTIECKSKLEKGTTFLIRLPFRR